MREGMACAKDGITINMFLVPSWSQSEKKTSSSRIGYVKQTQGRVFFTAGVTWTDFVVWDYVNQKREISFPSASCT